MSGPIDRLALLPMLKPRRYVTRYHSRRTTDEGTGSTLATRRFMSRLMAAKRPSRFSSRIARPHRRRIGALLNIPRHLFSEAAAATGRKLSSCNLDVMLDFGTNAGLEIQRFSSPRLITD